MAPLQEFKRRVSIQASNSTPRYIPKRIENISTQNLLKSIHRSIIHNSQKIGNNPNVPMQMDKQKHIHTVEYYSTIKSSEVLIHNKRG